MESIIHTKTFAQPPVNRREILRYMRCGDESEHAFDKLLADCLAELLPQLVYKVCWRAATLRTAVRGNPAETAAASAWDGIHGSNTLEIATIVKLTRTLAIIPITLVLALWRTHKAKTEQSKGGEAFSLKRAFPMFILYFVLASIITTVCTTVGVPAGVFTPLKTLSKFFIVMAMAAIGMNTNIVKLVKTGGKPIFMGFCCWVAIACVSIAMQHLLGFL